MLVINYYSLFQYKYILLQLQDFVYPDNVAYPIGGSTGKQFAMIEIHYNNPKETAGVNVCVWCVHIYMHV